MRGTRQMDFMARQASNVSADQRAGKRRACCCPTPLAVGFAGLGGGTGRDGASFTTRPRAAMTIRRRTADSAGRAPAARRCGPSAEALPPWPRLQAPAWRKGLQDALERFAVAFDGQVPVQMNSLSGMRTIQEHRCQIGIDCQGINSYFYLPLPLVGRGWGGGHEMLGQQKRIPSNSETPERPPTLNPSPQGGGKTRVIPPKVILR